MDELTTNRLWDIGPEASPSQYARMIMGTAADKGCVVAGLRPAGTGRSPVTTQKPVTAGENRQLTRLGGSDRLIEVGRVLSAWLSGSPNIIGSPNTGAPAKRGSRAGNLLLDLVRTGIENDFEKVVFPLYPELRDIKGALERAGSRYASLSGSGSTLYGLFQAQADAAKAVSRLQKQGLNAVATSTLTHQKYWEKSLVVSR